MKQKKLLTLFLFFIFIFKSTVFATEDTLDKNLKYNNTYETVSPVSNEPLTFSKNIIAIDRKTLSILYKKNPYDKVPMASTTKIMTCILALENCSLDEIVIISEKASSTTGSTLGIKQNMKISMSDLLYGLMLCSGNDCAVAIAEHISGSIENFSILMNKKAHELKLYNTSFITPHGLDSENHYTTAYELSLLTNYALENENFKKIVSTKTYTFPYPELNKNISNTNELLGNLNGVYGVKTGFTLNAGRCLVSCCKRNNLDIIVVVLGADTKNIRTKDSINIINYIYANYSLIDTENICLNSFSNYLKYFENKYSLNKTTDIPLLKLEAKDNYTYPINNDDLLKFKSKIYTITSFSPNISNGSKIGNLTIYNNDEILFSLDILLDNKLEKNTWNYYFKNIIQNYFK